MRIGPVAHPVYVTILSGFATATIIQSERHWRRNIKSNYHILFARYSKTKARSQFARAERYFFREIYNARVSLQYTTARCRRLESAISFLSEDFVRMIYFA